MLQCISTHVTRRCSLLQHTSQDTTVYFSTRHKALQSTSVHVTKHYSLLQHKLQDSKIYFSKRHKTLQSSSLGVRGCYFLERPSHPNVCKLLTDQKVLSFKTNYGTNKRQSNWITNKKTTVAYSRSNEDGITCLYGTWNFVTLKKSRHWSAYWIQYKPHILHFVVKRSIWPLFTIKCIISPYQTVWNRICLKSRNCFSHTMYLKYLFACQAGMYVYVHKLRLFFQM